MILIFMPKTILSPQGCYAQGDTYDETLENITDAIRLHLEDIAESGDEIPKSHMVSLTTVEISG